MSAKKSALTLKGMVKKPAKPVSIAMNEALKGLWGKKFQPTVIVKPSYKLSELLAQSDPNAPMPEDLKAWEEMKPFGSEII